jgi:deoxycytidine triphosphate deaminase
MGMIHIHSNDTLSTLTGVQEEDVQPNAVDLRLDKVFVMEDRTKFILGTDNDGKETKTHRTKIEISPDIEGYFTFRSGHSYEVIMENIIHIGDDEAGWVITRSTLNRNGLYITSGLYDSGYYGVMAGVLHVREGEARIKKGSRIGQFLLFKSQSLKKYDGDYGIGKEHDKKYE